MFKKYNSIENSYRSEFLDRIKDHGFWDDEYVVQEKAHGSNLSFWTEDGIHFRSAKRTGLLEEKDPFYNHKLILEESKVCFQNIWLKLQEKYADLHEMSIFGEIIGGSYPHKER